VTDSYLKVGLETLMNSPMCLCNKKTHVVVFLAYFSFNLLLPFTSKLGERRLVSIQLLLYLLRLS